MYRASTPRHVFYFDIDPELYFKSIQITYSQDGTQVLVKNKDDLTFGTEDSEGEVQYMAYFQLSQEDTKAFDKTRPFVSLQVRMLDQHNNVITSPIVRFRVQKVLNDEVLS